jgi:hypothetical protein
MFSDHPSRIDLETLPIFQDQEERLLDPRGPSETAATGQPEPLRLYTNNNFHRGTEAAINPLRATHGE